MPVASVPSELLSPATPGSGRARVGFEVSMTYIVHARLRQSCQVDGARSEHAAATPSLAASLARCQLVVPPAHHSCCDEGAKRASQHRVRNVRIGSAKALDRRSRALLQWSDRRSGRSGGAGCLRLIEGP